MEPVITEKNQYNPPPSNGIDKRKLFIYGGAFLSLLILVLVDPNSGVINDLGIGTSAVYTLVLGSRVFLLAAVALFLRKTFMPYVEADFQLVLREAIKSPEGAGLAALAISTSFIAICSLVIAALFI